MPRILNKNLEEKGYQKRFDNKEKNFMKYAQESYNRTGNNKKYF